MDWDILTDTGIDYKTGIIRCMGDANFYEKILHLFLQDDSFLRAQEAFARGDHTELFNCLHELKGVCGNADLTALYTAICPLVELLRYGGAPADEIAQSFAQVEVAYAQMREGISLALGEADPTGSNADIG